MSADGVVDLPSMVFFFAGTPEGLRRTAAEARRAKFGLLDGLRIALTPLSSTALVMGEIFVRGLGLMRQNRISVARTREQWIQDRHDDLVGIALNSRLPKLGDFLDRIDRFIYLPASTSYFKDLDQSQTADPYPGDLETLHFLAVKLLHQFPDLVEISRAALAALVGRVYRSRRMMSRVVSLSRSNNTRAYGIEHLPAGFLDQDSAGQLAMDFPGSTQFADRDN